ncbi:hypothetical protein [Paenibacillus wynnii]|uniref:Lipoprotein n=1 Tax=Paenibacillus wynnii TaxID=268407 RepID=A0A098M743_9BACL|nr:hypothetical protein [Paenibacillus wynnii]KGE17372.1 hypothetical protein PWYN_22435 [Paenibacillus wynnii]
MNKKIAMVIVITALCSVVITSCSSKESIVQESGLSKAMSVAIAYKKQELEAVPPDHSNEITLEDITKKEAIIKPLTTKVFFEVQSASRMYARALRVALIKNNELKVTYISFTEKSVTAESIDLTYTGTLRFGDSKEDKLFLDGTMTLLKEGDVWKVNNDIYNSEDILSIIEGQILNGLSDSE